MKKIPNLITGMTTRLPYLVDAEIRRAAQYNPGSVAPAAEVKPARAKGASPTARTLAALRNIGYRVGVVERWIPQCKKRIDLFGFIDLVYLGRDRIVGVQCCAGSGHAARRTKILTECRDAARDWINHGGIIEIWSWAKHKVKRGGKAVTWQPRVEEITGEDL